MLKKVDLKVLDSRLERLLPAYATPGSAGLDLRACIEHVMTIEPGRPASSPPASPYILPIQDLRRSCSPVPVWVINMGS